MILNPIKAFVYKHKAEIIISLILGLLFLLVDKGYHEQIFGPKPDITVSVVTVSQIPPLSEFVDLNQDNGLTKVRSYLNDNGWLLHGWPAPYYKGYDPVSKLKHCSFNFLFGSLDENAGTTYNFHHDEYLSSSDCKDCIDGYILIANRGKKPVEAAEAVICLNEGFYFKKEGLTDLKYLNAHCVSLETPDIAENRERVGFFKIYQFKESPNFQVYELSTNRSEDGAIKTGSYGPNELRLRNKLYQSTKATYNVWGRSFEVGKDSIYEVGNILVPNCSY